jgi:hypothetical protein
MYLHGLGVLGLAGQVEDEVELAALNGEALGDGGCQPDGRRR